MRDEGGKLVGVDKAVISYLDISVWVSLEHQLFLNRFRQKIKELQGLFGELLLPQPTFINHLVGQNFIQFCDQLLNLTSQKLIVIIS